MFDFLRSSLEEVRLKTGDQSHELDCLANLLPWPEVAISGYMTLSYTINLDLSLVEFLRDELGQWWKDPMHSFVGGLSSLPWQFVEKQKSWHKEEIDLAKSVRFGVTASKIKYTSDHVTIKCFNEDSLEKVEFKADCLICTLPLHIIRQLSFDPPLPTKYYDAIAQVNYAPATKIMIQSKTRFWENEGIQGGFSKTNMPIGQVHYPTNVNFETPSSERGILMCYTWKSEALLFGSQPKQNAVREAVDEIADIHPEIKDNFETGTIQAWYSDPASQGAYALLTPSQYQNVLGLMMHPYQCIYFGGEALSYSNGWIQGAIEAGLRTSYQFYKTNEDLFN